MFPGIDTNRFKVAGPAVMLFSRCALALSFLVFASCKAFAEKHEYTIGEYHTAGDEALCHPFKLTLEQVRQFFAKAKPISIDDLHDNYDYLPCSVEGTRQTPQGTWLWKIHPVGVAEVKLPDGTNEFWGCKSCDQLFE